MDNGSGVVISWETLSVLKRLGLRPKRTLRAVFWTAEEQGKMGGQEFYNQHRDEKYRFVMESDAGAFKPSGLFFKGKKKF